MTLPCVLTQVPEEVKAIAPAQLSFAGAGSVTQILKVPLLVGTALVEYTLT